MRKFLRTNLATEANQFLCCRARDNPHYEDQGHRQRPAGKIPILCGKNFPYWSLESSGMLQFVIWSGLGMEGLGCSLQRYNWLIDSKAAEAFGIFLRTGSSGRRCRSENQPCSAGRKKEFADLEERVKIFNGYREEHFRGQK